MVAAPIGSPMSVPTRSAFVPHDDVALVLRCRAGDAEAWRILVGRYERLVYSVARSFGLDGDEAADVLQSTFEALLVGLDRLHRSERLSAWLTTVAKRRSIRVVEQHLPIGTVNDEPVDESGFSRVDDLDELLRAIDTLSPACRRLVCELYLSSTPPTYDDVAARLGIPVGSIGPTRARCLNHLRHALTQAP
jgi:RNA polymerase sigma factor (sigma-70 family)